MSEGDSTQAAEGLVKYALQIGALELVPEGRKLKSGRISPFFFNSGLFTTGIDINRLAFAYVLALRASLGNEVDVIFGPAYKGIPLSVAVAMSLACLEDYHHIGYAFNRKEAKDHGEGGTVIGMPLAGRRVLVIDDVITTGESKREAVDIIRAQGGTLVGCIVAFDRQEKGYDPVNKVDIPTSAAQDFEKMFGVPLIAAATLANLISVLKKNLDGTLEWTLVDNAGEILQKVLAYQQQYGVL